MSLLETYLRELRDIRASGAGVAETSYYTPLANLLNEVGKSLKPRVRCILQLANRGAGQPDGGLFTQEQVRRIDNSRPLEGQPPNRGVVEVKPTQDDAWVTADGSQVSRYWDKYHQVLVTNYRDFVLVGQDDEGRPVKLESYKLASTESEFWAKAAHPRSVADEHEAPFTEYLRRVMLHGAPLTSPQDLAWFLASYARTAKARIEKQELPALASLRSALEESLGLRFEGAKGEHFFRSTLVQTLFYGVFSAWVLWSKGRSTTSKDRFDWRVAAYTLHVPMISALFDQIATPSRLGPLGLVEVLDWTGAVLNRVDRAAFFDQFDQGQAVQYFYEPFLAAFDPELRKDLGVWFTPPEIVRYMVERVDRVLREELDLPNGLADPNVYVLDPCAGTGSYLVEVLKRIAATLKASGGDALLAQDLKHAAMNRVFGFEILPAPFVVSHLQLGLLLQTFGAPLADHGQERVGVFLTNALTGWEPLGPEKERAFQAMLRGFPELLGEHSAAEEVKRDKPILVILGNPPYNAFAGVSPSEEAGLVQVYKERLNTLAARGGWGIKKFNLDDLYVRFFRLAERRIAEQTGKGIVCFISNFSYLGDPSFVVMRQRFLSEFDKLWFDCLNGDSRETGKLTPDGNPDPSVFSTDYNREGIRVGTAIGLMVRKAEREQQPSVRFRHFWGTTKRADLLESLDVPDFNAQFQPVRPDKSNRFSYRPLNVGAHYTTWPKVVELCGELPISGLQEMRKGALMDIDQDALVRRMQMYYDNEIDWDALRVLGTGLTENGGGFNALTARPKLQAAEQFDRGRVVRYVLYPLDVRWCYYTVIPPLWNRPRPLLAEQCWQGNKFFVTRMMAERPHENVVMAVTQALPDYHLLRPNAVAIPIRIRPAKPKEKDAAQVEMFGSVEAAEVASTANLSPAARTYLGQLGITNPDADSRTAELIWTHSLAIGYSPACLAENADGIRQDWPRVPLPATREALEASASLGRQVAALLDTEHPAPSVTAGNIRPELQLVGAISREGGGHLQESDLAVTAGWGHAGQNGVVMPGRGKLVERDCTPEELAALKAGAELLGLSLGAALAQLGEHTCDIYLNDVAYWRNVPIGVWEYFIGGYQVMKKWLSYREHRLLGRPITSTEVREVQAMARRIAAILLLQPTLDHNYQAAKAATYPWPTKSQYEITG
jgi:hypothetical protein